MVRRRSRSRQHMWACGGGDGNHRSLDGSDNDSFIHLLAVNTKLSTFLHTHTKQYTDQLHSNRFANELDGELTAQAAPNEQSDYRLPSALHRRVSETTRSAYAQENHSTIATHAHQEIVSTIRSEPWLFSCRWILERRTRIFVSCKSHLLSCIFLCWLQTQIILLIFFCNLFKVVCYLKTKRKISDKNRLHFFWCEK